MENDDSYNATLTEDSEKGKYRKVDSGNLVDEGNEGIDLLSVKKDRI